MPRAQEPRLDLPLPLDPETRDWLLRLSRVLGDDPLAIVASMLRDIRIDDETAHRQLN